MESDAVTEEAAQTPEMRVQTVNDTSVLEVTEIVVRKTRYVDTDLLRQKAYFEEMIAKGQAGLASVEERLSHINNAKTKGN